MNGATNDRVVSGTGSSIRRRSLAMTHATARPTSTPPTAARAKSKKTNHTVTVVVSAVFAVLSATSAVASLTRLSPSRIATTRRGIPTRRATAVAATASGGATTAPRQKAAAHENGSGTTHIAVTATTAVVKRVAPTDNSAIDVRLARKSTSEVRMAAAYSSGGSSPTSTTSGFSSMSGTPGRYPATTPTATRSRGGAASMRREAPAT